MSEDEYIDQLIDAGANDEEIVEALAEFRKRQSTPTAPVAPTTPEEQTESGGIMDHLAAGVGALNRGISKLVTEPLTVIGAMAPDGYVPVGGVPVNMRNVAQGLEQFVEGVNPRYENVNQTYQDIAEGVGQAAGMVATVGLGGASTGIKAVETATGLLPATGKALQQVAKQVASPAGFIGGSMTAAPEWEQAKAAGLSDLEAFDVLLKNYAVGQTEVVPIQNAVGRIAKLFTPEAKNRLFQFVAASGVGGIEEGLQEGFQTYLTNEIARDDYDPDRDPMFQVIESATIGAAVGLFLPGIGAAMNAATSPRVKQKLAEKAAVLEASKMVGETNSGDPVIDAAINNESDKTIKTITDLSTAVKAPEGDLGVVKEPLTLTETTLPVYDAEGNETGTKPASRFHFDVEGVGTSEGMIVGDKASILEIFAETDEEGTAKKGGGLYQKVIDALKSKGIKQLVVGVQSEGSTRALQSLVKKGVLRVAPNSETDISNNPIRFNIENDLVTEFDETGALLGGAEESKKATRAAASEQIADFLRGKVKTRGEVVDFQDNWNLKHPERKITDNEALEAWNLIKPAKVEKGETITLPINEALKEQIKTFYRGMEKGVRKGQKLVNENLIPKVQEALKTAKLTPRQISAILTKVKTANLFTPGSQSKLTSFIDKVVNDAQYAEKLAKGKSLQKRARKFGRQKNEKIPVKYKVVARSFGQVNPSEVENLDEYNEMADRVIAGFRPVESEKYAPINTSEIEAYIEKALETQEEQQEKTLKETEEKDLSELKAIAESSVERLRGKDLGGLDARAKEAVGAINKIDLEQLDRDQLKRLVKIVDNIVENDDFSGEAFVENIAAVQTFIKDFGDMVKGKKVSEIGLWAKTMNNISNMMMRLYQDNRIEAFFRSFVHGPVLTAGSQVEDALVKASERFDQTVKRLNKKYKTELRDISNKADQMVFSLLYQMDNDFDLAKMRRNIRTTITRHQEAGNEAEAAAWEQAFKKFETVEQADPKRIREIIEKENPAVYEMWKTFGNDEVSQDGMFTEAMADEQARVTKEVYNREYAPVVRYTPIVQHDVNTLYKTAETIEDGGTQSRSKKSLSPNQARTAKRRTLNLSGNKVYTLEPYTDWILRYGETLYDNKAAKVEARMAELIRHPEFTKLLGGPDNAIAIANSFEKLVNIQRGTNRLIADNEAETLFTELAKTFRSIGTIRALASVSQIVKQSTVMVKLSTNLMTEGDGELLPAAIHAAASVKKNGNNGAKKLLEQSTLIARGLRMGGTDRGNSEAYKLQRGARRWFFKMLENSRVKMDKRTRNTLSLLVRPDLFNARSAFFAYYLQSLKHQGIRNVDLNKEHELLDDPKRKLAMAHAENMVEKTQTASNPAAMSAIQRQTESKGWEFVKTVFLPFSTFDADFKARMVNEVSALRRSPSSENAVRLAGTVGEALAFAGLNAFALYWYKEGIRNLIASLAGVDREEKEPEEHEKRQRQQFISSITGALNPVAIGTIPQEMQSKLINNVGFWIAQEDDPELTKKEWMKENALVYEAREGTLLENLGPYSGGISPLTEAMSNLYDLGKNVAGEPITVVDGYGNEKLVRLTKDQQNILILKTLAETLTLSGLTEADVANAIRTVYREQMKEAEVVTQTSNKKSFKRKRRNFKRDE